MACPLKSTFCVSGLKDTVLGSKPKGVFGLCSSFDSSKPRETKSSPFPNLASDFKGKRLTLQKEMCSGDWSSKPPKTFSVNASICLSRALRWWEKTLKPNMVDIHSGQQLADSLVNAGDRLVVVDFYSPGCGGCRALHPKICQLAESYTDAIFLKVNYEELKTMCHCLHIHVLPFFRFYRGAEGRVCSFSCTNATIKKFKDALAKHGTDRCSLGPTRGLEEFELKNLASIGEISMSSPLLYGNEERVKDLVMKGMDITGLWSKAGDTLLEQKQVPC